jgi:hypothetical protein
MKIISIIKKLNIRSLLICTLALSSSAEVQAQSEVLQGSVQENDSATRLARPSNLTNQSGTMRIGRPTNTGPMTGLVDTDQSSTPSNGNLRSDDASLGLVQPNKFQDLSANNFDLGADRGSRELVIAWERWYKQLSAAIYERWSLVADVAGHAIIRITVTNNRSLNAILVKSSGNSEFDNGLIKAILSLDGNPGLTFPTNSERKSVSLESDYIAGTDIQPGYNWIRNDVEKVQESY